MVIWHLVWFLALFFGVRIYDDFLFGRWSTQCHKRKLCRRAFYINGCISHCKREKNLINYGQICIFFSSLPFVLYCRVSFPAGSFDGNERKWGNYSKWIPSDLPWQKLVNFPSAILLLTYDHFHAFFLFTQLTSNKRAEMNWTELNKTKQIMATYVYELSCFSSFDQRYHHACYKENRFAST